MASLGDDSATLFETNVVPDSKEVRVHFPGARQHALAFDGGTGGTVESPSSSLAAGPLVTSAGHFDAISYSKGAALLAMFEESLGSSDRFQAGVRDCLAQMAYGSTSFFAFVACVSRGAGSDGGHAWVAPFVFESSFPLVDVAEAEPPSGAVRVKALNHSDVSEPWPAEVPVAYVGEEGEPRIAWIGGEGADLEALDGPLNWRARGYYRVRYSPALLRRVLQPSSFSGGKVDLLGRLSALADAVALHRAGLYEDRESIVAGIDQMAAEMGTTAELQLSRKTESQWFRQRMLDKLRDQMEVN